MAAGGYGDGMDATSPGLYHRRGAEQVLRGRLGMLPLVAGWGCLALGDAGTARPVAR